MDSRANIITLIYYLGIASCAVQGAEKGKCENSIPVLYYITNAFGGGFIRDVILLGTFPWLFSLSALPSLILVVIVGLLYTYYFFICKADKKRYRYSIAIQFVTVIDWFALGSFVAIGMDKAFDCSSDVFTIIACGYVTAVGGGVIASRKPLTKIFKSKEAVRYHLVTLLGCCGYYVFRHSLCLIYFIVISLFLTNINYKTRYNFYSYNKLIIPCLEVFLSYPVIYNKNYSFQRQKITKVIKKLNIYPVCPKIYLVQRRIRQC